MQYLRIKHALITNVCTYTIIRRNVIHKRMFTDTHVQKGYADRLNSINMRFIVQLFYGDGVHYIVLEKREHAKKVQNTLLAWEMYRVLSELGAFVDCRDGKSLITLIKFSMSVFDDTTVSSSSSSCLWLTC